MIQREIVLPVTDNNGRSLDAEVSSVLCEILDITGGYSAHDQIGAWRDDTDGKIYQDKSIVVSTLVESEVDWQLQQRIYKWCELLRQICILTVSREVQVQFVSAQRIAA